LEGGWEPPELGERPVAELVEQNRLRGVRPAARDRDACTASARRKREADIPDQISFQAMQAMPEAEP
jgi:hypothetical protein